MQWCTNDALESRKYCNTECKKVLIIDVFYGIWLKLIQIIG